KRRGIDLLPPRRRRRRVSFGGPIPRDPDEEILAIHERHQHRFRRWWTKGKPWLKRFAGVAITGAIFFWMLRPVARNWGGVRDRIFAMHWGRFAAAAAMFAVFLFVFRATTWRWILLGMG